MGRKQVAGAKGLTGRLFIDGSEFCITNATVNEMAEEEEITNSCSAGFNEYEYGNKHLEGSVEADWDVSLNPFDTPFELKSGSQHAMKFYLFSSPGAGNEDGPFWECDIVKINNVSTGLPSKGKLPFSFDYKTSGPYSYPTGSESSSG